MLKRIYIDNFRCLVNFYLSVDYINYPLTALVSRTFGKLVVCAFGAENNGEPIW